jgi:reductive dehalogenase
MERLAHRKATDAPVDVSELPSMQALSFDDANPLSIKHSMARFIAMFDLVREGQVNQTLAEIPQEPQARSEHLKAAGYYFDASMMGVCSLPSGAHLATPITNPLARQLGQELAASQPKSFAAGMDMILADIKEAAQLEHGPVHHHTHALVILVEYPRDPGVNEAGCEWLVGAQAQRAATLSAQTAVLLSSYLRLLGYSARAHSATCSEVHLEQLAVLSGLCIAQNNPFIGNRFGLAVVTTNLELAPDAPLANNRRPPWWAGLGTLKSAFQREAFAKREYRQGAWPFETLTRQEQPTTFIDHERVPRFPKRADFFARALFGDLGKATQEAAKNAHYVMKSPIGACARRALGALLLLQFGEARGPVSPTTLDAQRNADNLKAAAYYLSCDAVGLCEVPTWAYYSHDAGGNEMPAYHRNAINMLVDQGHETMEGASGDDWISVAQSMRAYLRFSMVGGIIAEQVRRLGYSARVHSVLDGDVLQPPLLLLSGLGEVSRIGEVILNPFLGPRLKSGTVTTNMPMTADKPINFGLQTFCEACNKCARECPSGAITAGPKLMYNGYEIWKSDAEKCARYRITNLGGGMCGRCMKTCPWNLEGLFADSAARWVAMHLPKTAPLLAKLDDALNRGDINPVKKWWWDIELDRTTQAYVKAGQTHARGLNKTLSIRYEEQNLAVYPADVMPAPYPILQPVQREAGLQRYRELLTPAAYRKKLAQGDTTNLAPPFKMPEGEPPVFPLVLHKRVDMGADLARYEFVHPEGKPLPAFDAGAHIDVVIAPEYARQYSLAGDPADQSRYVLGVQREANGRGGSALMHRAFQPGRRVFVSPPRNHFPLDETASFTYLIAAGIGVTPMLTMAHRLHALGLAFKLLYCIREQANAGFLQDIAEAPWARQVTLHESGKAGRIDMKTWLAPYENAQQLYTCGSAGFMQATLAAASTRGWPADALHQEFFSVPEAPERSNHGFDIVIGNTGQRLSVAANESVTQALERIGRQVPTKCSDGLCGVCVLPYDANKSSVIDHRDYVLSAAARATQLIACCSRPEPNADGSRATLHLIQPPPTA